MSILASAHDISERKHVTKRKWPSSSGCRKNMMCIADTQGYFRQLSPAL